MVRRDETEQCSSALYQLCVILSFLITPPRFHPHLLPIVKSNICPMQHLTLIIKTNTIWSRLKRPNPPDQSASATLQQNTKYWS